MIRIIESTEVAELLERKAARFEEAESVVRPILDDVRTRGDRAVFEYAAKFDGFDRDSLLVPERELEAAADELTPEFRSAVETAAANIRAFARLQLPHAFDAEIAPGIRLGQIVRPLDT